jgi:hypothetical protein
MATIEQRLERLERSQKRYRFATIGLLLCVFLGFSFTVIDAKLQRESKVLAQKNCPIEIVEYKAEPMGYGARHEIDYKNGTVRGIVAIEFRFVLVDVFEQFIQHSRHLMVDDIDPRKDPTKIFYRKPHSLSHWHRIYSDLPSAILVSYIYIYKVRFEGGEIWEYDKPEVINQIVPNHIPFELEEPGKELDTSPDKA